MRRYKALLFALVLLLTLAAIGWRASKATRWQAFGELTFQVETSQPVVALTFDDGPMNPDLVDEVLKELDSRGTKATFFLNGEGIARHPTEAQRIVAAGHQLGNHSYSHQRMVLCSTEFVREELEKTDALIRAAGYDGPIDFRPPYGKKLFTLPLFLARTGRRTITWSIEAEEDPSRGTDAQSVADYVLERVRPGSIILFHVFARSREAERKALPMVLEGLRARGYQTVTVSELLAAEGR